MKTEKMMHWIVWGVLVSLAQATSLLAEEYYPREAMEAWGSPRFVVPDPDAKNSTAQAAIPGQSKVDGYISAFYAYERPAASYRVTWRLKIDDNTIPGVVVKLATHNETGGQGYKGGALEVKGTDFKAAGKYQDFSYVAEKPEGGFFSVASFWAGKGRVHIDSIKIVAEKFFTEREILEKAGKLDLPEAWLLPKPVPPVVHIGKGLWWNFFGLSEAMAELGGAVVSSSYHASGQYGMSLGGFPTTWQQFMTYNLIILVNVDAQAVGPAGRLLLEEFVKNGGGLLVCGGPFAFEPGNFKGTALESLIPCEMTGKGRIKAEGGFVLKPGDGAKGILPDNVSWQGDPRVYYYHEVKPKKDAKVLAMAGDKPILMAWQVGKGRVAVFAATAEGEPAPGQLAFWDSGDTPRVMAGLCRWLMQGQGQNAVPVKSEETKKLLGELMAPSLGDDTAKREQLIQKLLSRCHDAVFAKDLLAAVSSYDGTPDRTFVLETARAVAPFLDASSEKLAKELIESGNVGKASLGLQVLGASRAPGALATITKFLENGTGALKKVEENKDDMKMDDLKSSTGDSDQRLKLSAVIALGDLGDPANLTLLKKETEDLPSNPSDDSDVVDLNENIFQQGLASRAMLGEGPSAGLLIDEALKNAARMEDHQNCLDVMLVDPNDKVMIAKRKIAVRQLPILRQRQALCMDKLRQFPYSAYPGVAAALVRINDEMTIPFGYAALALKPGKKMPPEVAKGLLPLLENCKVPELRLLALNLIASVGDVDSGKMISSTLNKLATSQVPADVKFALRQLGRLPATDRSAVVKAALAHPDPKIKALAQASVNLLPEGERKALTPAASAGGK